MTGIITTQSFKGETSVKSIKDKIQITLKKQKKAFFIDELEKKLLIIGNKLKEKTLEKLDNIQVAEEKKEYYNNYYYKIQQSDFSHTYYEFNELFDKNLIKEIDINKDIEYIKSKLENIEKIILPVMYYYKTNAKAGEVIINIIKKLIWNTKFHGKKNDETVKEVVNAIYEEIHEYSLYAITKGINQYIRNNTDFPTLKEIIDMIEPINDKCLVMYVNIQFLLSV